MAYLKTRDVHFGPREPFLDLAEVYYALKSPDGETTLQARQAVPVTADPDDPGVYAVEVSLPAPAAYKVIYSVQDSDDPDDFATEILDLRIGLSGPAAAIAATSGGTVVGSILARMAAIDALVDALPGGIWFGPPDEEADDHPPYAVLTLIGERPEGRTSCGVPAKRTVLQMSLVGQVYDQLVPIYDTWEANFHEKMTPLLIDGREFRALFNETVVVDFFSSVQSPSGYNTVILRWDFEVTTAVPYPVAS